MDKEKLAATKFYTKLFSFLELNQALKYSGYCGKFIHEMNEEEFHQYLILLEYLNERGVINLDSL